MTPPTTSADFGPAVRSRSWGLRVTLAGLLLLGAWWVWRPEPVSAWVSLQADPEPVVGRPLRIQVRVAPRAVPGVVVVDLHWSTTRRHSRGFLCGTAGHPVPAVGGTFDVEVTIPERPDLGFVRAVVYFGPTARWEDRSCSASSRPWAVVGAATGGVGSALRSWPVHDTLPDPGSRPTPVSWAQWLTGGVWLLSAVGCVGRSRWGREHSPGRPTGERWRSWAWVLGCLLAVGWEWSAAEVHLGVEGRLQALNRGLYEDREQFQKIATFLVFALAAGCVAWIRRRGVAAERRLLLFGWMAFIVLAALGVVSLHALDHWANAAVLGLPAMQWLKLTAAGLGLAGAWHRRVRSPTRG